MCADLFGGVAQAGGEEDVMTSAPAGMPQASADPGKLTGQRNENSALFLAERADPDPGEGRGAAANRRGLGAHRHPRAQREHGLEREGQDEPRRRHHESATVHFSIWFPWRSTFAMQTESFGNITGGP